MQTYAGRADFDKGRYICNYSKWKSLLYGIMPFVQLLTDFKQIEHVSLKFGLII